MREKREQLEDTMLQLWKNAEEKNISSRDYHHKISDGEFTRDEIDFKLIKVRQRMVVHSNKLVDLVSNVGELKMIARIDKELKRNNALWHFEYRKNKGRDERTILSLRRKKILIKTDQICFHIVNPFAIRKGTLAATIAATILLQQKSREIYTKKSIRHLDVPESHKVNYFHLMTSNSINESYANDFM